MPNFATEIWKYKITYQAIMKKTLLTMVAAGVMATGAMAQTATFKYFSYEGNDSRFDKTIDNANEYFNPVMAGCYADA